jgi:UDP-GlcNAc3NAcA epimerase
MKIKIVTIVGARPQFIKAAAISRVIRKDYEGIIEEVIVHTGQHYDHNMSSIFFDQLEIPTPKYNLNISGVTHGVMTGRMLELIEEVLIIENPNWVVVYGDTNSTLAGALAAIKLQIPIAHIEAGLRSFNMKMPEEVNRILTDSVATLLFCPTETAVENLNKQGITYGVHNVGDVMFDVALYYKSLDENTCKTLVTIGVNKGEFVLATCHRAENTDNLVRLEQICQGLADLANQIEVILPLHPRTRRLLSNAGLISVLKGVRILEPLPFMDMFDLERAAKVIITDSGGVQKEAFFYGVPCITMREETEWVETVDLKWNKLVGASRDLIVNSAINATKGVLGFRPYGDGQAAQNILKKIIANS